MSLRIFTIESTAELRRCDVAWDDLWLRSPSCMPRARAAIVTAWLDHFAPRATFRALIAERDGRFLAAIPLVFRRLKRTIRVAALPGNDWAACGELLLDLSSPDAAAAADILARELARSQLPMLWLDYVPIQRADWRLMLNAFDSHRLATVSRPQFSVGIVERQADFASYELQFARRYRRNRRRNAKQLAASGGAEFRMCDHLSQSEVDVAMQEGFAVEDRSWKGANGTSILKNPRPLGFYLQEARQLAAWDSLDLAFLRHANNAIAFQYGIRGKGVHFIAKCGYDESFSRFGPGVQLMAQTIEWLHDQADSERIDFCGPLTPWTEEFVTDKYDVARVVGAPRGSSRQLTLYAYAHWAPRIKKLFHAMRNRTPQKTAAASLNEVEPRPAANGLPACDSTVAIDTQDRAMAENRLSAIAGSVLAVGRESQPEARCVDSLNS